ncbi:calcineurin B-like protein 7 isoform X2 [Beta vulgaris subsp. vulgaris]|nr:calcineurin B-like protein 7 isoform X2 [Beta vulgaris subsp. vulgaris]XP_057250851.1 calcineurin B-like protein 7 isoform X2 [Beta vulgaris subsp. vulgaris]XP_057250852.1 calcineurin B-like protein 7 isoform X2 [Beta vulgaris subsp. vulgaris]
MVGLDILMGMEQANEGRTISSRRVYFCSSNFDGPHELPVSASEVEALYVLYKKVCSCIVLDGLIRKEEFRQALLRNSGKPNLFVDRVFDMFDLNHNGVLEFGEFVLSLSIFHPKSPIADKISFTFNMYDVHNKGYIEREEVKKMVVAILEESDLELPDDIVEAIVENAFMEADSKRDGKIDLEEWKGFVANNPSLLKNMTLPYLMDVGVVYPSFVKK